MPLPPRFGSRVRAGPSSPRVRELAREIAGGERLLWQGTPVTGVRFGWADLLVAPFGLFWLGFSLFWVGGAMSAGAPVFFWGLGLPFVGIGLYLVVGRFFYDAWRRGRTAYAVTSERVVALTGGFQPAVVSLRLATIRSVTLSERSDGIGTIGFQCSEPPDGRRLDGKGPVLPRQLNLVFALVPDVRAVHDILQAALREAERRGTAPG